MEWEAQILTSHHAEGEAVHAGLVAPALEMQRQPEGLAPPYHQPLLAQVRRVVVTAIGLQLQVASLQNQVYRDSERHEPWWHRSASCDPLPCTGTPWARGPSREPALALPQPHLTPPHPPEASQGPVSLTLNHKVMPSVACWEKVLSPSSYVTSGNLIFLGLGFPTCLQVGMVGSSSQGHCEPLSMVPRG